MHTCTQIYLTIVAGLTANYLQQRKCQKNIRCNFIKSYQLQVSKHFLGHGKLHLYTAISEEHLKNIDHKNEDLEYCYIAYM